MRSYYLYLESYVFLFIKEEYGLLFDSVSSKKELFLLTPELRNLFKQFHNMQNMYTVLIGEDERNEPSICHFIDFIRENFLGDIIPTDTCRTKMVIFPPVANCQMSKADGVKIIFDRPIQYLTELTFFINGVCLQNCTDKCHYHLQTLSCKSSQTNGWLSLDILKRFVNEVTTSHVTINITGGNIFLHPEWKAISLYFSTHFKNVFFVVHYRNMLEKLSDLGSTEKSLSYIIIVDDHIDRVSLTTLLDQARRYGISIQLRFEVVSEESCRVVDEISISEDGFFDLQVVPIYNNNIRFFRQNVLLNQADLDQLSPTKKQIFANQIINTNFFGKLVVDNNGLVYTNLNTPHIGNYSNESLPELVLKALDDFSTWKRVRNSTPCTNCVYQWLCPAPSDYEFAMANLQSCTLKIRSDNPILR